MAAPSVGRRSCAVQREAAALISQSAAGFMGVSKGLLYDGFFSLPSSGRCFTDLIIFDFALLLTLFCN